METSKFYLIGPPKHVGHVEMFPGFRVFLTEMPAQEHQEAMTKAFGFKFTTYPNTEEQNNG